MSGQLLLECRASAGAGAAGESNDPAAVAEALSKGAVHICEEGRVARVTFAPGVAAAAAAAASPADATPADLLCEEDAVFAGGASDAPGGDDHGITILAGDSTRVKVEVIADVEPVRSLQHRVIDLHQVGLVQTTTRLLKATWFSKVHNLMKREKKCFQVGTRPSFLSLCPLQSGALHGHPL